MTGGVHKLRMGVRVMEALKMKQPSNKSEDLEAKIKEYDQFHQKISQLVTLLNHRHEAFLKDKETRLKLSQHLLGMSADTPIFTIVGKQDQVDTTNDERETLYDIYKALDMKSDKAATMFFDDIITHVTSWEKAVSSRIRTERDDVDRLRQDVEHYDQKVQGLQSSVSKKETKGVEVQPRLREKLERNDEKLTLAKKDYEAHTKELLIYTEEVTERGWKDLIPVIIHLLKWEMETAEDVDVITSKMANLLEEFKKVSSKEGFDGELFRIKALKDSVSSSLLTPEKVRRDKPTPMPETPETAPSPGEGEIEEKNALVNDEASEPDVIVEEEEESPADEKETDTSKASV